MIGILQDRQQLSLRGSQLGFPFRQIFIFTLFFFFLLVNR